MKSLTSRLSQQVVLPRRPRPSAKTLSHVALSLWVASLALTGLVLYAKQQRMTGVGILALGWLSPLIGNFAWFANPLFLWSLLRLRFGKPAVGLALLSVLLSLDAFRFSKYLLNEGGGSTPVYGYGWGFVLWLAALLVLLAAAGTRQIETRLEANSEENIDEWLRPMGFALCITMLITAGYLAIQDRTHANGIERERLSGLAFKRGPVCRAAEPSVQQPMGRNSGPVEVKFSEGAYSGIEYPFNRPTDLLEWGIPIVRFAGRDYSYASAGDGKVLTSVPASTPPAGVLAVAVSVVEGRQQIGAKLVEQYSERTVFDQVWRQEAQGVRYCPDYSIFPKEGEQPRKLMSEALSVQSPPSGVQGQVARPREPADNRVNAVILSNTVGPGLAESSNQQPARSVEGQGNVASARRPWMGNRNCPSHVGWDGWGAAGSPVSVNTGVPFMVGDRAFYPGYRDSFKALCEGDHAYLFFGVVRGDKYYLTIEKRMLSDFRQVWSGIVVIQDQFLATGNDVLQVDKVDEGADGLTISLTKEQTGRHAVITAPLRLTGVNAH